MERLRIFTKSIWSLSLYHDELMVTSGSMHGSRSPALSTTLVGHFGSVGNKGSVFALSLPVQPHTDERLEGQNLLFGHCVVWFYS